MRKKNNQKITVMVTGAGGGGVGEQIFKALKMAKTSYRIVAADALPVSKSLYEADARYLVPKASEKDYLERILAICEKEKIKVLIPGSEPELKKISTERDLFVKNGILPLINDRKVIELCMDKWQTCQFLADNNLGCPKTVLIKSEEDISQVRDFPVVIKPATGSGGSINVFIAQDADEFGFFARYLLKYGGMPLVQEYVGSYSEEYTVGVLTSFDGELLGSIALKRQILSGLSNKLKITNLHKEKIKDDILAISSGISQGIIDDYPDVRQCAEKIALELGSRGPLNIQCRKTEAGIFTFEINPRFSGTTCMRAMADFNEPDILIRQHVLGETIAPQFSYKHGIVMRGLEEIFFDEESLRKMPPVA